MLNFVAHHNCGKHAPPINYEQQFNQIFSTLNLILIEARNHNQTVAIDWDPVLQAMQLQVTALETIRSQSETIGAAQLAAAEKINNNFLNLSRQISDFQSATMEASAAMLKIEGTQAEILQQISSKLDNPIVVMKTFKGYWRSSANGGSLLIPAGAHAIQVLPMGCFAFDAITGINDHTYKSGEGIVRGGSDRKVEPSWLLKFPPLAEVSIEYTSATDIGYPETEDMVKITKSELSADSDGESDAILAAAIAAGQNVIQNN